MELGKIQNREITEEMKESYLDYAMSVIVSRALPDVRDGLKPVQRRILYAMHDLGLTHTAKFRKSAAVVGEVMGKYHPHGDAPIYEALARMAQSFSLRYPLINGQGNFGSVDGDSPAAMRYTEERLTNLAEQMLVNIEKETVPFIDNYDGSKQEPSVLPSKIPQLLLNGVVGIAVGMATNIPPHNLTEVIDGAIHLINYPKATIEDLLEFIKGPDFPTGGIIYNTQDIVQAYSTGRGAIVTRGETEIVNEKSPYGRSPAGGQIIIKEIPFQVNKATMIEKIADLVKEKKIDGIRDVRDESDKDGMRVVLELKSDARPQKILNNLYQHTDLQKTFHLNMLGLVDGVQPQILSLKDILQQFISHRQNIITRRTQFDLARTKERIHILQGLKKALDHIDAIIQTIKKSKDRETAQKNLEKDFKLTAIQATAILEMRLQTLAGLERQKITDELEEKEKLAKHLEALLKDPKRILEEIKKELTEIKEKFGDERKTKIVKKALEEFKEEDLIPEEETVIILTRGGYIKRLKPESYRLQKRGGKGVIGAATKEEDVVEQFITANTHDDLLFFTDSGKIFKSRAFDVPESSKTAQGKTIFSFLNISSQEKVTAVLSLAKNSSRQFLVLVTKNGLMKKIKASDFQNIRNSGLIIVKLKKDDLLKWVRISSGNDEIILITKLGKAIRFPESNIRAMGRQASGVHAMKMKTLDEIVGMDIIQKIQILNSKFQKELLIVLENGYGKTTNLKFYKKQKRGGSGVLTAKVNAKTGQIVSAKIMNPEEKDLIAISQKGQVIRMPLSAIPSLGRATQGVRIMRLDSKDKIASITTL